MTKEKFKRPTGSVDILAVIGWGWAMKHEQNATRMSLGCQ